MKLSNPLFDEPFEFDGDAVKLLVIESQECFSSFLQQLVNQVSGSEGQFVLSDGDKIVPMKGRVDLIFNPFDLNPNNKQVMSGIYSQLISTAVGANHYVFTNELLSRIRSSVDEIVSDLDPLLYTELPAIGDIIKAVSPNFDCDLSLLARICT